MPRFQRQLIGPAGIGTPAAFHSRHKHHCFPALQTGRVNPIRSIKSVP